MKQLQNNYTNPERLKHCTTPEQSKRLLDLGLPANSADCYYDSWKQVQWRQLADLCNDFFQLNSYYAPCWSVGKLVEIELMCHEKRAGQIARLYFVAEDNPIDADTIGQSNITESLIRYMESALYNYNFSKLEE